MERCEPERTPGAWEFCLSSPLGLAYLQHDHADHVAGNAIGSVAATTCQRKGIINSSEFPRDKLLLRTERKTGLNYKSTCAVTEVPDQRRIHFKSPSPFSFGLISLLNIHLPHRRVAFSLLGLHLQPFIFPMKRVDCIEFSNESAKCPPSTMIKCVCFI